MAFKIDLFFVKYHPNRSLVEFWICSWLGGNNVRCIFHVIGARRSRTPSQGRPLGAGSYDITNRQSFENTMQWIEAPPQDVAIIDPCLHGIMWPWINTYKYYIILNTYKYHFLGGWTSICQPFSCSPGVPGFEWLTDPAGKSNLPTPGLYTFNWRFTCHKKGATNEGPGDVPFRMWMVFRMIFWNVISDMDMAIWKAFHIFPSPFHHEKIIEIWVSFNNIQT